MRGGRGKGVAARVEAEAIAARRMGFAQEETGTESVPEAMLRELGGRPGRVPGFAGLRRARSARRDRRCAADAAGAAWQAEAGNGGGSGGSAPAPGKGIGGRAKPAPLCLCPS